MRLKNAPDVPIEILAHFAGGVKKNRGAPELRLQFRHLYPSLGLQIVDRDPDATGSMRYTTMKERKQLYEYLIRQGYIEPRPERHDPTIQDMDNAAIRPHMIKELDPDYEEIYKLKNQLDGICEQDYNELTKRVYDGLLERGYTHTNKGKESGSLPPYIENMGAYTGKSLAEWLHNTLRADATEDEVLNNFGVSFEDWRNLENPEDSAIDAPELRYLSPAMLHNLIKSGNRTKAIKEVKRFITDNKYRFVEGDSWDSLNSIRNAIKNYQEQDRIAAENAQILEYIVGKTNFPYKSIKEVLTDYTPEEYAQLREEALKNINAPFEYADGVRDVVHDTYQFNEEARPTDNIYATPGAWKLLESPDQQLKLGERLDHCYGNIKKYGPRYFAQYRDKIRSKRTILINNGDITAEIMFDIDEDGTIEDASIVQIMGPSNQDLMHVPEIMETVDAIAMHLVGMNVNSISPEEREKTLSDICCKYILHKPSQSLLDGVKGIGMDANRLVDEQPIEEEGPALGIAHNPNSQYANLAATIAAMRY